MKKETIQDTTRKEARKQTKDIWYEKQMQNTNTG